jgi:hypothetical protein
MGLRQRIQRLFVTGDYEANVRTGLDEAFAAAGTREADIGSLRAVIFSDHHRGTGDGADDFKCCEQAYCAALGFYEQEGFELWLLGDVEELWENADPAEVLDYYANVLELEASFGGERLHRFFGNHDILWDTERAVDKHHLAEQLPDGVAVREALKVRCADGGTPLGTLFLVHGHQGTPDAGSRVSQTFSKLVVRKLWAPIQRMQTALSTAPSQNAYVRGKLDQVLVSWADEHPDRLVLVAGHTHRPVFPGTAPPDAAKELAAAQAAFDAASGDELPSARAALERAKARKHRDKGYRPPKQARPAYFNSGCCSFGDGDVTGLVIDRGKVSLVRWLDNDGRAAAQELESGDLREIFSRVAGAPELRA